MGIIARVRNLGWTYNLFQPPTWSLVLCRCQYASCPFLLALRPTRLYIAIIQA